MPSTVIGSVIQIYSPLKKDHSWHLASIGFALDVRLGGSSISVVYAFIWINLDYESQQLIVKN